MYDHVWTYLFNIISPKLDTNECNLTFYTNDQHVDIPLSIPPIKYQISQYLMDFFT